MAFLDADDTWLPNKIERQVAHLRRHPEIALVSCHAYACDEQMQRESIVHAAEEPSRWMLERLLVHNVVLNPTCVLVRRPVLERVGGFSDLRKWEDWDTWLRIAKIVATRLHSRGARRRSPPSPRPLAAGWLRAPCAGRGDLRSSHHGCRVALEAARAAPASTIGLVLPRRAIDGRSRSRGRASLLGARPLARSDDPDATQGRVGRAHPPPRVVRNVIGPTAPEAGRDHDRAARRPRRRRRRISNGQPHAGSRTRERVS